MRPEVQTTPDDLALFAVGTCTSETLPDAVRYSVPERHVAFELPEATDWVIDCNSLVDLEHGMIKLFEARSDTLRTTVFVAIRPLDGQAATDERAVLDASLASLQPTETMKVVSRRIVEVGGHMVGVSETLWQTSKGERDLWSVDSVRVDPGHLVLLQQINWSVPEDQREVPVVDQRLAILETRAAALTFTPSSE
ncbi:MAG: hypothetical protein H6738_23355 [Alphaproteobacteria bacterium]|nr:hypothetical protein [Alphaproteobacteria bacterium]